MRTYYDLDEIEALNSLYDSFRQYLKRNRSIAASRKSGYLNLFKFTRNIAKIKTNLAFTQEEKSLTQLKHTVLEIKQTRDVFNEDWVLEKIADLEKIVNK